MIWSIVAGGVVDVVKGWFEVKKAKQLSEAEYAKQALHGEINWDLEAMRASRFSWKDEVITLIWFSPLYVGWFKKVEVNGTSEWIFRDASEWVKFVGELPMWWQIGAYGIIAASFGLRWLFSNQQNKLKDVLK